MKIDEPILVKIANLAKDSGFHKANKCDCGENMI